MEISRFDWGGMDIDGISYITKEIFVDKIYERYREVQQNDIVMDIGANVGAFTASILHKNPRRVFAVEPSNTLINSLWNNTKSELVTYVNAAIADEEQKNVDIQDRVFIYNNQGTLYNQTTFRGLVDRHKIDKIDFMKIDCEGGEYSIFNEVNKDFILNNVGYVAGEWHLSDEPIFISKFKAFKNLYLTNHKNYYVFDRFDRDVTKHILDDEFIDYYNSYARAGAQFLIYMINN